MPAGQALSVDSAPVVVASDNVLKTDLVAGSAIDEIRTGMMAVAGAKGVLADLRTSIVNTPSVTIGSGTVTTVTTCTTVTTVSTVTNQAQMGGLATNVAVPNWQNQTAVQSFINNIARF